MEAKTSNYEQTKHKMQKQFLNNDLDQVAAEWELRQDPSAIYLTFLSTPCAIDRQSGAVIFARDGVRQEADFNVSMTIFDILSRPRARASGEYMPVSWFSDMQTSTVLAGSFFSRSAKQLAGRTPRLARSVSSWAGRPGAKETLRICCRCSGISGSRYSSGTQMKSFPRSSISTATGICCASCTTRR